MDSDKFYIVGMGLIIASILEEEAFFKVSLLLLGLFQFLLYILNYHLESNLLLTREKIYSRDMLVRLSIYEKILDALGVPKNKKRYQK